MNAVARVLFLIFVVSVWLTGMWALSELIVGRMH